MHAIISPPFYPHKFRRAMLLGSLPACMIAMMLFRDPSSEEPTHDMPGGANRFISRSRTVSMPLPVAERGSRYAGRRVRSRSVKTV